MIQGKRADEIRKWRINPKTVKKTPEKIIQEIKSMADWYNKAIDRAVRGGVPKTYLPSRGKHLSKKRITTVKQAERAWNKIRELAWSDVGSVRDYKRLIREAENIYGAGRKFKLIKDPAHFGRVVAVPYGTNKKRSRREEQKSKYDSAESYARMVSAFWKWYNRTGNFFMTPSEAGAIFDKAMELNTDPIKYAEEYIRKTYSEDYAEYSDIFDWGTIDDYI